MPIFIMPQWLHANLTNPNIKIIDASWHMPASGRNGRAEYEAGHIAGAQFFDIDAISDHANPLPHMLPNAAEFAQAMGALGIAPHHHVIVYDTLGLFSSPRVRFTLKAFGHAQVSILEGGLPAWLAAGFPLEVGNTAPAPCPYPTPNVAKNVVNLRDVARALADNTHTIIDARAAPRYLGQVEEPRPGLGRGHIPTARNVPFADVIENGALKPTAQLLQVFTSAGVNPQSPIIASCASGVTACIVGLALEHLGNAHWQLYDGSWSEWGAV